MRGFLREFWAGAKLLPTVFRQGTKEFQSWTKDLDQRSRQGEFGKWPWQKDYGLWPWQRRRKKG